MGPLSWSKWNLEMLIFVQGGELENAEKRLGARREPTTNARPESNLGHIGRKGALSPSLFLRLFCNFSMCTDLRAAVPQSDHVLFSPAESLPDVALASIAPSTSFKYSSTYNRWKSWARDHGLTTFPAPPFHLALCSRHLVSEAKTASPRVRRSQHCLDASVGWRAVSYGSSVGEEPSFWCTTFTGPSHIQEGVNRCLPARIISCL